MTLERLQAQLLSAILDEVPFEGWTPRALARAATVAEASATDLARAFPAGPVGALVYWNRTLDAIAVEAIAAAGHLKTHEKVTLGVRARLEAAAPHKDAVRRGLGFLALPGHAKTGIELLTGTLNAIWYAAGDRSTDFNYYTKRGLLSGVFLTSLLYWLNDDSEGGQASWAFLDRQIANALRLPTLFAPFREGVKNFLPPFCRRRPTSGPA